MYKKGVLSRLIYLGVCVFLGLIGTVFLGFGVSALLELIILNHEDIPSTVVLVYTVPVGVYLIYIAYLMFWKLSSKAIKHVSVIIVLTFYGGWEFPGRIFEFFSEKDLRVYFIVSVLIWGIMGISLYKYCKKFLIKTAQLIKEIRKTG